jgi:hypothetical protein
MPTRRGASAHSRRRFLAAVGLAFAAALSAAADAAEPAPPIAAASDLNYALKEVAEHFAKDTGK